MMCLHLILGSKHNVLGSFLPEKPFIMSVIP